MDNSWGTGGRADTWQGGRGDGGSVHKISKSKVGQLKLANRHSLEIDPQVKTNTEEDKCSFSALNWIRNAVNVLASHVIL